MTTFTYNDRDDAIRQIEERLGSEGTPEIARLMYQQALADGAAARDEDDVLTFSVTQRHWDSLLDDAGGASFA
jgi:predicted metal-dependent phosphoesterase TrpH